MNNLNNSSSIDKIRSINQVEGFDPSQLAVEYTDFNTGETRMRLPIMAQMAWFRLLYPQGKISVTVTPVKEFYVASARLYTNYQNSVDAFLAEATASRKYDPEKPTVSPREWAQTAAIGIALRNAGFGLQFSVAGDSVDQPAVDEVGELITQSNMTEHTEDSGEGAEQITITEVSSARKYAETENPSEHVKLEEDPLAKAMNMVGPITKNSLAGKTLGQIAQEDPKALIWVATKYNGNPEVAAGAKLICEASQLIGA